MSRRLPFPFPMGIGTDICHIPRIKALLTGPQSARFIRRILRPDEYQASPVAHIVDPTLKPNAHLPERSSSEPPDPEVVFQRAVNFMAGRFAIKEAVIKAHSFLDMNDRRDSGYRSKATFQRVQIVPQRNKSLTAVVWPPPSDEAGKHLRPSQEALVSISHDGEYATAMCLAYRHPEEAEDQTRPEKVVRTGDGDGQEKKKKQKRTKRADVTGEADGLVRRVKAPRSFLRRHPFAKQGRKNQVEE